MNDEHAVLSGEVPMEEAEQWEVVQGIFPGSGVLWVIASTYKQSTGVNRVNHS